MARPRKSEERDTRKAILEAALDLFAAQSYRGTSMREIARAVGVKESALYHHFPSKADILEGLVELAHHGHAGALEKLDLSQLTPATVKPFLNNLVRMVIGTWATEQERKLVRVGIVEAIRGEVPEGFHPTQLIDQMKARLIGVLSELMRRKLIAKTNPEALVHELMGPLVMIRMRYFILVSDEPDLDTIDRFVEQHLELFWKIASLEKK